MTGSLRGGIRRTARVSLLAVLALTGAVGCEDPIIVVGDLPGIMRRVAGVPNRLGASVDSLANRTELNTPRGLALADDGTLYIADSGNGRIIAVSPAGRTTVLADAASCTDVCLVEPYGLDVGSDGSIWIADPGAHRIFRLSPETGILETVAGTGVQGHSDDFTPVLEANLNAPTGIALSNSGVVYFSERAGHRIRWIHGQGGLRTIAGTGEAGYSEGSPATNALLNEPMGMDISGSTLYFADALNHRVRSINLIGGTILRVAGNGVAGFAETDSIATTAKLNQPRDVTVTPDGTQLFIADGLSDRVRVVNLGSGRISRFAGTGEPLFNGEGLDAADTSIDGPSGLVVHTDGTLFISDSGHQIVWRTPLRF